jgi:predicted NodU family carbamoyl transferase
VRRCAGCFEPRGLTLADVDVVAINGLPHAYLGARECVRVERYVYVPHHLAHAALAARTSPWTRCNVLTVDGRGEYETAAWFTYRDGELRRRAELPAGEGRSIGGAYETVTRVLGFGAHGQGQTMALAGFASPGAGALDGAYRVDGFDRYTLDEAALQRLASERMGGEGPMSADGWALAAAVQAATEHAVVALARAGQAEDPDEHWAIAGGVALNCCANSKLRDALGVDLWVPSAAHDAGTALGAALEAAHLVGEPPCGPLRAAGLGPDVADDDVDAALAAAGLSPVRAGDPRAELVSRLMDGRVVGWVSGRLEFGPRALGHRSIIAHPGLPGIQDRVNAVKDRQRWRPFGPSVLAEHAADWFRDPNFGPFMTHTAQVLPERQAAVAAVVHVDGTTRPQAVEPGDHAPVARPARGVLRGERRPDAAQHLVQWPRRAHRARRRRGHRQRAPDRPGRAVVGRTAGGFRGRARLDCPLAVVRAPVADSPPRRPDLRPSDHPRPPR